MTSPLALTNLTLRDPDGALCQRGARLFRFVWESGTSSISGFLNSSVGRGLVERKLISSRWLPSAEIAELGLVTESSRRAGVVLEHPRLFFPSYPQEWSSEMLGEAALLTLELAERSLAEGFGLKDASPYNVLFEGPNPVFVDVLSFESRTPEDSIWRAVAQFYTAFYNPLLALRDRKLPLQSVFMRRREGLACEELYAMTPFWRRLGRDYLSAISLPVWLAGLISEKTYERVPRTASPDSARYVLGRTYQSLRRQIQRLRQRSPGKSDWLRYDENNPSYVAAERAQKDRVVGDAITRCHPRTVLDVGCNTGRYSVLAAKAGARVVAIDSDAEVVNELWRKAYPSGLDILPLVVDLAWPTPGLGWDNGEVRPFLERAAESFDLVLALAVSHHLSTTGQIPLTRQMQTFAGISRRYLLLEYVSPSDPQFKTLARGRDFGEVTEVALVQAADPFFRVVERTEISEGKRALYLFEKK